MSKSSSSLKELYDMHFVETKYKYEKIIDDYIKKLYPKSLNKINKVNSISLKNYVKRSKNISKSLSKINTSSHTFRNLILKKNKYITPNYKIFLFDYISRRILKYELKSLFYKEVDDENDISKYLKNYEPNHLVSLDNFSFPDIYNYVSYWKISEHRCVKICNLSALHFTNNFEFMNDLNFLKEVEITKIAGNIGVGPKVHDAYVCSCKSNGAIYGFIEMDYKKGIFLNQIDENKTLFKKIKNMLEKKINKLYEYDITIQQLSSYNIYIFFKNISKNMSSKSLSNHIEDVQIIDYTFANYIKDYVFNRNHIRLNEELFHYSRYYIYQTLTQFIFLKLFGKQ